MRVTYVQRSVGLETVYSTKTGTIWNQVVHTVRVQKWLRLEYRIFIQERAVFKMLMPYLHNNYAVQLADSVITII